MSDPINPDLKTVTPSAEVARLTRPQREQRMHSLMSGSEDILRRSTEEYLNGREIVSVAMLWSGGNDSNVVAHWARDIMTHVIHANTGIGIEQTRQHVRDWSERWGKPLLEKHPPVSYREMVLERGFPGPMQHWKMYTRLKERCIDEARRDLGVSRSRKKAVILLAGRRREESKRRKQIPLYERDGSAIWVSPMAMWTKLDMTFYRTMFNDVPRNPVADLLHASGECLCGAFAHTGELDEINEWFPDVVKNIRKLEREAKAAGIPYPLYLWGWGADPTLKTLGSFVARQLGEQLRNGSGPMCTSCDGRRPS